MGRMLVSLGDVGQESSEAFKHAARAVAVETASRDMSS
jgi:hypothetical protein